jgi:hypothetical protein
MIAPIKNNPRITLGFGVSGWGHFGKHAGIDYGVPVGTPVYAPGAGRVRFAAFTPGGGNLIELDTGTYWHRFLHLDKIKVTEGQYVAEGQLIGLSGATGDVTGPHTHWDVRKANTEWSDAWANYINPLSLIKEDDMNKFTPAQVNKLIAIAFNKMATDKQKAEYSTMTADEVLDKVYRDNKPFRTKAANADKVAEGLYAKVTAAVKTAFGKK